ncbi:MAG TPA: hypothetical protein VI137_13415 [Pseudolabrys sp.]
MNVKATAYHEAGHAVVAAALRRKVHSITIIPDAEAHGRVRHESPLRGIRLDFDGSNRARLRAEEAIMIFLGGPIAERRAFPRSLRHWHTHGDYTKATDISGSVCGSTEEESAFLNWLAIKTQKILDLRWNQIERIAAALIERRRLSGKEIVERFETVADSKKYKPTSEDEWPIRMLPDGTLNVVSEDDDEEDKKDVKRRPAIRSKKASR